MVADMFFPFFSSFFVFTISKATAGLVVMALVLQERYAVRSVSFQWLATESRRHAPAAAASGESPCPRPDRIWIRKWIDSKISM